MDSVNNHLIRDLGDFDQYWAIPMISSSSLHPLRSRDQGQSFLHGLESPGSNCGEISPPQYPSQPKRPAMLGCAHRSQGHARYLYRTTEPNGVATRPACRPQRPLYSLRTPARDGQLHLLERDLCLRDVSLRFSHRYNETAGV